MPVFHLPAFILGQIDAGIRGRGPTWEVIAALVLAGISLLVVVPTVLGLRHARRQRELEHAERMRALELGHPLPGSEPSAQHSPALMIGLWVPISALGIAFVAQQHEAWIAAALVGVAGVVCGTVLAMRPATQNSLASSGHGKPRIDPSAYEDLAERR
jgi:hypothetical protein